MAMIDTLLTLAGGGALAEGLRYLRTRATTHAGEHAETERTGRHAIADRAAHNAALLARVERLELQKDECGDAVRALDANLNQARAEIVILKQEIATTRTDLEATRTELGHAIERAQRAEERVAELTGQVEELRERPLSNPPVASGD